MNGHSKQKTIQVKRFQRFGAKPHRLRINGGGQQVDGIPDAALLQHAVKTGEERHGDAAGEPALDAGGDRISLQRKKRAVEFGGKFDSRNFDGWLSILICSVTMGTCTTFS